MHVHLAAQDKKLDSLMALVSSLVISAPNPVAIAVPSVPLLVNPHEKAANSTDYFGIQELQEEQLLHKGVAHLNGKLSNVILPMSVSVYS